MRNWIWQIRRLYIAPMVAICLVYAGKSTGAQTDQLIGVRIAEFASQTVLASPPLPSLEEDRRFHLIPHGSYMVAKAEVTDGLGNRTSYSGDFTGWSAGLGFTTESSSHLSWFGFSMFTKTHGSLQIADTVYLRGMNSTGYNLAGGANLRLWSAKSFLFTVGLIAGPFISRFESTFDFNDGDSSRSATYDASSFVFGPMSGAQLFTKILGLKINPYALYFYDLSDPCQTYSTNSTTDRGGATLNDACTAADPRSITLKGTFWTYGLNVGVFGLSFGAYSVIEKDKALDGIDLKNYAISYSLSL